MILPRPPAGTTGMAHRRQASTGNTTHVRMSRAWTELPSRSHPQRRLTHRSVSVYRLLQPHRPCARISPCRPHPRSRQHRCRWVHYNSHPHNTEFRTSPHNQESRSPSLYRIQRRSNRPYRESRRGRTHYQHKDHHHCTGRPSRAGHLDRPHRHRGHLTQSRPR